MVSVVMSAYNSVRFIREAIESILNQTYQDFELIIVDDGSTDETLPIAASYAERDSRVRVIRANHGGQSRARNTGIQHAQSDWVAIMDADDVSLPTRLEKQLKAAGENPKVVAWGAYAYHIDSAGRILSVSRTGPSTEEEFHDLRRRARGFTIIHSTALLRKAIVQKAGGYDARFDCAEDLELLDRMAEYGPILAIPRPLALFRIHASSNTMQRFFEQQFFTRYVQARLRARLSGEREPGLEEFREHCRRQPVARRLRRFLNDSNRFYYRRFGLAMADGQYVTASLLLAASVLLNPAYTLPRIWNQRLSPTARRWLEANPS